ncbi:MAG: cytochrome c-type biogenesis protein CcmH [Candidatus Pelagibacter sp.]|nr:cytochrome c-type biogenesis protein CcmH [Candidatus Pelagibacter sp.]OUW24339.1 MAG: hypothetical protein CBD34_01080 [Rickettsiales bacterium TMED174]|tara:strand:+ start:635 stop:1009 length:375 start_codon:yes stop_codon:yes gene_type:complete
MKKIILLTFILNCLVINSALSQNYSQLEIKVFKNLRCLVCQGQSIADSNSDFAQTVKSVVSDKIKQGKNEKEIYDFLSSKYGSWIVYKPNFDNINLVLWIIPYIFLIFGAVFFFKKLRKNTDNR